MTTMLNTAPKTERIIIHENHRAGCSLEQDNLEQGNEIKQLRQRITELEDELASAHEELIRERYHANIDLLTGIPNRRSYQIHLQQERLRCMRDGNPLCLAVWDIDHFKTINDRFGHQAGDKVLQCVARQITHHLRRSDFTARIGGEEFASLLPDCDTGDALRLAEELRNKIHHCNFATELGPIQVTLSCGIAQLDPNENDDALFARADSALYKAKSDGRNQVSLAGS